MARIVLRIVAGLCFACSALAWSTWWNLSSQLIPLNTTLVLRGGETVSSSFTPAAEELEQREYRVQLRFTNSQSLVPNCSTVEALNIQWSISTSQAVEKWDGVVGRTSSRYYSCVSREAITTAWLSSSPLQPNVKYYLHLRVGGEATESERIESNPVGVQVIRIGVGIEETHYSFIDLGFSFLFANGFLLVGVLFFLIDLALVFRKVARSQPNRSGANEHGM